MKKDPPNKRNRLHAGLCENSGLTLELLDDEWSISDEEDGKELEGRLPSFTSGRDNAGYTSASVNSLDLEWEHLPEMVVFSSNADREEPKSVTSAEGWSRISSADSLEWDHVKVEMKEEVDTETEQLLQEIEMLSTKALQETQDWTS
ncbi:hypothetical protein RUM43_014198 [Polyplax serrata]|uniref:Uncharacterized protein n=1 Tax=Polyplax serrata TaxID=468196 RepID=A0AAN8PIE4_POLSC